MAALACGCSVHPSAQLPDGSMVTLGGSLLEQSSSERATLTGPGGWRLTYEKLSKDQVGGAARALNARTLSEAMDLVR